MQDLGEPTNLFVNRKTNKMEWNDIEKHQVQTLMVIHIKYLEKNEHIFYVFCILFKENERKKKVNRIPVCLLAIESKIL